LFLGPGPRPERLGRAHGTSWDWDGYHGEAIAEEVCEWDAGAGEQACRLSSPESLSKASQPRWMGSDRFDGEYGTAGSEANARSAPEHDNKDWPKQKSGWRNSLYLWGKFSVAIMLAIGGAVINGPEEMLRDCAVPAPRNYAPRVDEPTVGESQNGKAREDGSAPTTAIDLPAIDMIQPPEARPTSTTESKHLSEERVSSAGSARSLCGAGAGRADRSVQGGPSPVTAPSRACPRRQAAGSHRMASKTYPFGFPGRDERDRGIAFMARAASQSSASTTHSPPRHETGHLGTLKWAQAVTLQ
jgi:hypothetical protein